MSDINIAVPLWAVFLLIALRYWPVLLMAAVASVTVALLSGGMVRIVFAVLATLLVAASFTGVLVARREADADLRSEAAYAETNATLTAPTTIDGLLLPEGGRRSPGPTRRGRTCASPPCRDRPRSSARF